MRLNAWLALKKMIEHWIVGATGVGYLVVGVLQLSKGSIPNALIWIGYAAAQVGLWMNIK